MHPRLWVRVYAVRTSSATFLRNISAAEEAAEAAPADASPTDAPPADAAPADAAATDAPEVSVDGPQAAPEDDEDEDGGAPKRGPGKKRAVQAAKQARAGVEHAAEAEAENEAEAVAQEPQPAPGDGAPADADPPGPCASAVQCVAQYSVGL